MRHTTIGRLAITVFSIVTFFLPSSSQSASRQPPRRPNIVLIISDDQRYDTMDYMPRTQERIFNQGITFSHGYVTSPTCTPSRGSILTGMYAYRHGAVNNNTMLDKRTFVHDLHDNGYTTALVGKFMNPWDGSPRPEYDFTAAYPNDVKPYPYTNPTLLVNDVRTPEKGYSTTILCDYAVQFLNQAAQQSDPFALVFSVNAPHLPTEPAPGDETLYPNLPPHRPPNFNEADMSDKPRWMQEQPELSTSQIAENDSFRRRQLQTLHSLDQSVDRIMDTLEAQGKLDDTIVMYLSDNGVFWGEHRGTNKQWAYEEASHVPFAIRYPGLIKQPHVEDRLVANIDIAPTLYELAGLPVPKKVDGQSLVPLLDGTASSWRDDLMIETVSTEGHYYALHTGRYVYITMRRDRDELYDLETDPYQLDNLIDNPSYAPIVTKLAARLDETQGTLGGNAILSQDIVGNPTADLMQRKWIRASSGTLVLFEQLGTRGIGGVSYTYSHNADTATPIWTTPVQVDTSGTNLVAVEKDDANNIYIVLSQPQTETTTEKLVFKKLTYTAANDTPDASTSPWTAGPAQPIASPSETRSVCCASLALDSRGTAWVASRFFDGTNYSNAVQSASGPAYDAWSKRVALDTPSRFAHRMSSVVAHDGRISVIYITDKAIASRWRDDADPVDAWHDEQIIDRSGIGTNSTFSVTADRSGNLHLVYTSASDHGLRYQRWSANSRSWESGSMTVLNAHPGTENIDAASITAVGDDVYVFTQDAVGPNQFTLSVRQHINGRWKASAQVLTDPWERTFDKVWSVSGVTWQDLTAAAASDNGDDMLNPHTGALLSKVDDTVYVGMDERFDYVYTYLSKQGKGGTYSWEYWDGTDWTTLLLSENPNPKFNASSMVYFRSPRDWQKRALNSESTTRYYVRVRVQEAPTTPPIAGQMTAVKNNRMPATPAQAVDLLPLAWTEGFGGVNRIKQRVMQPGNLDQPPASDVTTPAPRATSTPREAPVRTEYADPRRNFDICRYGGGGCQ